MVLSIRQILTCQQKDPDLKRRVMKNYEKNWIEILNGKFVELEESDLKKVEYLEK